MGQAIGCFQHPKQVWPFISVCYGACPSCLYACARDDLPYSCHHEVAFGEQAIALTHRERAYMSLLTDRQKTEAAESLGHWRCPHVNADDVHGISAIARDIIA
jgi:hypothetical protein